MAEIAAVVVNRNTRDMLRDCLLSIQKQDVEGGVSVWVVDNGSADGSPEMVLTEFPDVNLVWNHRNAGYSRACNRGIGLTEEPFILVLNADTVLAPSTASRILGFFSLREDAGAVGPRILNTDGTLQYSCREFPTLGVAFFHAFIGLFSENNRWTRKYMKKDWDHGSVQEVDWVSGAFMGLRREAVEAIGGFDDGYFMYVEDVDLCWRLKEAGWTVWYFPDCEVVHHIGSSTKLASTRMSLHHHMSMFRFYNRTYRGSLKPLVSVLIALGVASRFLMVTSWNLFLRTRARVVDALRGAFRGR